MRARQASQLGGALGDFVRCMRRLAPADDGALAALAAHLGYGYVPSPTAPRPAAPPPARKAVADEYPASDKHDELRLPPSDAPATAPDGRVRQERDPGPVIPVSESPWRERPALDVLPHPGLLKAHLARSIVRTAISARRPLGSLDVDRLLAAITRGRPIRALPRRLRWWACDTDVLVDTGEGMLPFRRDQASVIDVLCRLIGRSRVEVWHFHGDPTGLLDGDPEDVLPPDRSRAWLVLSDLGAGDRSVLFDSRWQGAWRRLGQSSRRAAGVLVLTPYGSDAAVTDPALGLPVVTWDEQTRPSQVSRARRKRQP